MRDRGGWWWLLAALCVAFGAGLRAQLALRDPGFDARDPRGMLVSDPAELHYLARRIARPRPDEPPLGADPRIAWPERTDVPREFAVGQELLLAPLARTRPDAPLHVLGTVLGAVTAALSALALFGLALELWGSRRLALLAAAAFTVLRASYRTVGFVWMREDLSLPLLALAAWLAARAARVGTPAAGALAGFAAAAAAATWHGAGVGLALLAVGLTAGWLAGGRAAGRPARAAGPDAGGTPTLDGAHRALSAAAPLGGALAFLAAALAVPALRAKAAGLSLGVSLPLALAVAAAPRPARRGPRLALAAALVAGAAVLRRALVGKDLAHVGALLLAKLEHGGVLPADPARVAPDVRLMWQGPFEGLAPGALLLLLGVPLVVALPWLVATLARRASARDVGVAAATCVALALALLAERAAAFAALAVPLAFAAAARAMARLGAGAVGRAAALALLGLQALLFLGWSADFRLGWGGPAPLRAERRALVAEVAARVPAGAPVLTDFMTGPALLADHDRPIVLQPKWETAAARARVQRFLERLFHGTPDEFAAYVRDEARCQWVLLDRRVLVDLRATRYAAGLRKDEDPLRPGSALAALLGAGPVPAPFEVVSELAAVGPGAAAGAAPWHARLLRIQGAD